MRKIVEDCNEEDDQDTFTQVTEILVGGGTAIFAAINRISQNHKKESDEEFKIWLRHCFAHVIRMGTTHGGRNRGGKGLLPQYFLDHKIPPKGTAKMMSIIIILFNYIPDGIIFEETMKLLYEEFGNHVNEHVKSKYFYGTDPRQLGG